MGRVRREVSADGKDRFQTPLTEDFVEFREKKESNGPNGLDGNDAIPTALKKRDSAVCQRLVFAPHVSYKVLGGRALKKKGNLPAAKNIEDNTHLANTRAWGIVGYSRG